MSNVLAVKFVKQLCAAFSRFPVQQETRELYARKLSNWRLSQNEWDDALDKTIEYHKDENLPALSEIYGNLKSVTAKRSTGSAGGLAIFQLHGQTYAMRVVSDGAVWLIADVVARDANGNERHLQQNVGRPLALHAPAGAENIQVYPDHPAHIEPDEIADKSEVRDIVAGIVERMSA